MDSLSHLGISIINRSEWLNAVTAYLEEADVQLLSTKTYVRKVSPVRMAASNSKGSFASRDINFGALFRQINSAAFKQSGLSGKGVVVGIMDSGFELADEDQILKHIFNNDKVLGVKDFVNKDNADFFHSGNGENDRHGVYVWRMMAGKDASHNEIIGLANDASFYLARTDNGGKESRVEEDNWVSALEWFHKQGVKVVNSSIGYSLDFDQSGENHRPNEIDGKSTMITRAAQAAAEKGMIIIVAAGNEGENKKWRIVSAPADAQNVISVGATDEFNLKAVYSGIGPQALSYVKPNVSCYSVATGTSFSAPVITGIVAAMLEKDSSLTAPQIAKIIEASSNLYPFPNNYLGYGVPDCERILKLIADPDANLQRSTTTDASRSLTLDNPDKVEAVAFHKRNSLEVIKQVKIAPSGDKLVVKQMADAPITTVVIGGKVIEVTWK